MVLVILAAACVAAFAITFRYFERFAVPLQAAITVNYVVAFVCGLLLYPPFDAGDTRVMAWPCVGLGCLFVTIFSITGISAQRAGAARTTIAGRMSLVLTVAANLIIFEEHLPLFGWAGIALSVVGLVLSTRSSSGNGNGGSWVLPLTIFLGSGVADIGVSAFQRTHTTSLNEGAFTTLCFGAASAASLVLLFVRRQHAALKNIRTWTGGAVLGTINYASLLLLVAALGAGAMPASAIFPLMNIGAILLGTLAAIGLFKERLSTRQWAGIVVCIAALSLIMMATV